MIRLYLPFDFERQSVYELDSKKAHYLLHVMRLKAGEEIELINGKQGVWSAKIQVLKKKVSVELVRQKETQKNLRPCILCPALIKKEAMDLVLQKATELGATEIYPVLSERTVVSKINQERAESIIYEACEQCERMDVPVLHEPKPLQDVLAEVSKKADIVWLSERGTHHDKKLSKTPALFVGPEGGWSPKEQELFRKFKAIEWHLGQTILRAETASIVGLALCLDKKE